MCILAPVLMLAELQIDQMLHLSVAVALNSSIELNLENLFWSIVESKCFALHKVQLGYRLRA